MITLYKSGPQIEPRGPSRVVVQSTDGGSHEKRG